MQLLIGAHSGRRDLGTDDAQTDRTDELRILDTLIVIYLFSYLSIKPRVRKETEANSALIGMQKKCSAEASATAHRGRHRLLERCTYVFRHLGKLIDSGFIFSFVFKIRLHHFQNRIRGIPQQASAETSELSYNPNYQNQ